MSAAKETASDDEEEGQEALKKTGYCHFNEDGSNKTFSISLFGHDLDIEQDPSSQMLGHGAVVWDAAVIFSKYMEHDPKQFSAEKLHGKSVIELGSGCGLGGIAFMMKGAKVMLTDLQKVTEALTVTNTNRISMQLIGKGKGALPYPILPHCVRALDWTAFGSFQSSSDIDVGLFDFILLTDCVFSAALAVPLVDCILKLADTRCTVYCCHEIRDEVILLSSFMKKDFSLCFIFLGIFIFSSYNFYIYHNEKRNTTYTYAQNIFYLNVSNSENNCTKFVGGKSVFSRRIWEIFFV